MQSYSSIIIIKIKMFYLSQTFCYVIKSMYLKPNRSFYNIGVQSGINIQIKTPTNFYLDEVKLSKAEKEFYLKSREQVVLQEKKQYLTEEWSWKVLPDERKEAESDA